MFTLFTLEGSGSFSALLVQRGLSLRLTHKMAQTRLAFIKNKYLLECPSSEITCFRNICLHFKFEILYHKRNSPIFSRRLRYPHLHQTMSKEMLIERTACLRLGQENLQKWLLSCSCQVWFAQETQRLTTFRVQRALWGTCHT